MAKDFFDEEYDKKNQQSEQNSQLDSWYSRPAPEQATPKRSKPLYIALLCIALVVSIAFGWVLGYVFQGISSSSSTEGGEILNTVIDYLQNYYYKDIPEEQWMQAIELSGTALMQYAGDRFSMLMSPQTYYDFMNPTASTSSANSEGYFGVSFIIEEGIGLYVSSVTADSNAYGQLFEGDIVLQLTEMKNKNGVAPTVGGVEFNQINFSQWSSASIQAVLDATVSAKFHVLRLENGTDGAHYVIREIPLARGQIVGVNTPYNFEFIEFYFNDTYRNISTPLDNRGTLNTYDERGLSNLPEKTGYVRITQFMDYTLFNAQGEVATDEDGDVITVSASDEFRQVMSYFKELGLEHLVLDLKGNPGGNVSYVSEIAGMLVTDAKLSSEDRALVAGTGKTAGQLLITYLEFPKPAKMRQSQYEYSGYYNYFAPIGDKCDIVVWTDGNSASASELLTGTLRDYGTAVQMGTTTYGKGIAQTWQELPFTGTVTDLRGQTIEYPWAVYYTCASYYSPLGTNIHGVGYTPDEQYNNLSSYSQLWEAAISYWS